MSSIQQSKAELLGSLLLFTQVFYKLRTGREFIVSSPAGRESHVITICKALVKVFSGETKRLIINIPPRYGKTELLINFIAWALAHYADCNFMYVSYSLSLAKKQTQTVRQIISMPEYRNLFEAVLSDETSAKDNFETVQHGSVYAAGAEGTIVGRGAGLNGINRFGGAIVIDDIHKPSEVTSDTMRAAINDWYHNTLQSRLNNPADTPIIFIGQRLHEDDLPANLLKTGEWDTVILPAIDVAGNALDPRMHDIHHLREMEKKMPYEFASQYQQTPQPAGGGIFKPEWWVLLPDDPHMLATFITADTAETEKEYNDATVFSFWGIYRIHEANVDTDILGLHWIDCEEIRVEPKDLEFEFKKFYSQCLQYKVKPRIAAIEKKSTGTTLVSILNGLRGLQILDIERTAASGNKTTRFLEIQPYIASKRVSIRYGAKHMEMCINHMKKITANNSHRHDDIADTCADAVKKALIEGVIVPETSLEADQSKIINLLNSKLHKEQRARGRIQWQL